MPTTTAVANLVLRASLALVFLSHALLKLLVFTLPGTAQFFISHGLPGWSAGLVFGIEFLGGLALLSGLYTRWVALLLIPVMCGAVWVHFPNGWMFANPNGGWEYPAFLLLMLIVQALSNENEFTLKHIFKNIFRKSNDKDA